MKFIIFIISVPLVYSEIHRFMTTYTGIRGQTTAGFPEFTAVTTLDDHQIDYYDSDIMELIPKQNWMKDLASKDMWKQDTEIRLYVQQMYKNNIPVLMQRFSQSHGLHTYQRMYGCYWDDDTGESQGFDQYSYDGEDFISLDLKQFRYFTTVPQGIITLQKWNNGRKQLESLKQYYKHECVYWLRKFFDLFNATFERTDPPKVSLLEKKEGNYTCHVTGFHFRNTTISWRKNGQAMNDSSELVKSGETLPNEDGTFQRTLTLSVPPDEYKETQYTCVVEHQSLTETIQKTMTVNQIMKPGSDAVYNRIVFPVTVLLILLIVLVVLYSKRRKGFKAPYKYVKTRHLPSEYTQDLHPLIPNRHTHNDHCV